MARTKKLEKNGSLALSSLSFADLSAMLLFVGSDRNKGFNSRANQQTKVLIDMRFHEIEEELYRRVYGKNPFEKQVVINGQDPKEVMDKLKTVVVTDERGEPVDGAVVLKDDTETTTQTFVVKKNVKKVLKDEMPQTFVVAKEK
jgi:hypothetical protein